MIMQDGHTQLHVKFPVLPIFPCAKMNMFYFLRGLHLLFNHNFNLKIIYFPWLVQIPCGFSCQEKLTTKFPVFPVPLFAIS